MTDFFIALFSSFCACYAGAIMLNTPRNIVLPASIGGVICWISYIYFVPATNMILANFLSSILVAIYSQIMARVYKAPVTLFFIPGYLPIVPGLTIYRTAYYYISGHSEKFIQYLSDTIKIATMIALAIVVVDALFKAVSYIQKNRAHQRLLKK